MDKDRKEEDMPSEKINETLVQLTEEQNSVKTDQDLIKFIKKCTDIIDHRHEIFIEKLSNLKDQDDHENK